VTVLTRIAIVLLVVVAVIVVARLIGRWQRPGHPPIDLGDFGPRPGVILFTSTDCMNCKQARAVVESLGLAMREVTWELEPALFDSIGVEAVPLTAVVDQVGSVEWLAASVPRKWSLQRAAARAGLSSRRPGGE
jgi:hypothetical protein